MKKNALKYVVLAAVIAVLLALSIYLGIANREISRDAQSNAAHLEGMVSESDAEVAELEDKLLELESIISENQLLIAEQEKTIEELSKTISDSDATIAEQQKTIEELEKRIEEFTKPRPGGGGGGGSNSGDNLGAWTDGWD